MVGDPGTAARRVVERLDPETPHRPDIVIDGAALPCGPATADLVVRAASVRGLSHRASGRVRQDEYGMRVTSDGRHLVIAVADGVSKGTLSHHAAMVVARYGCVLLEGWLRERPFDDVPLQDMPGTVGLKIVERGRTLLSTSDDDAGRSVEDIARHLSSTALFAMVDLRRTEEDRHRVRLIKVGDTSAWILRSGGRWESQYAIKNENAAIASSSTAALPALRRLEEPVSTTVGPGEALMLVTDGIGDPLGTGDNDFGDFLAEVWAAPPTSTAFAAQVDFARLSFDDDRTAVVVWPG